MRRTERHHLKENALAEWLLRVQAFWEINRRVIAVVGAVIVCGIVVGVAFFLWEQSRQERAGESFARAMTIVDGQVVSPPDSGEVEPSGETGVSVPFEQPPGTYPTISVKLELALPGLLDTADSYPSLPQGIAARYQAASALVALGRPAEAKRHFGTVMETAGDGIYGRMAALGLAEIHFAEEAYEDAIRVLESEMSETDLQIPGDAVLMRLGTAHQLAGELDDARESWNRLLTEFPTSPYRQEAERELGSLSAGE